MTTYRAPSASLASTTSASSQTRSAKTERAGTNASVQGSKAPNEHATSRHIHRAHKLDKARAAVKDAAKHAHKCKELARPCTAYVGNIGPGVDEDALKAHFRHCGKILSVRIHCCGGVPMIGNPPPVGCHKNMRISQYAIIVFGSRRARQRACQMVSTLAGRELAVSIAVSELPEIREKILDRMEDYRRRREPADKHRAQKSAHQPLKLEPTIDAGHGGGRRLHRQKGWFGLSFAEGIA